MSMPHIKGYHALIGLFVLTGSIFHQKSTFLRKFIELLGDYCRRYLCYCRLCYEEIRNYEKNYYRSRYYSRTSDCIGYVCCQYKIRRFACGNPFINRCFSIRFGSDYFRLILSINKYTKLNKSLKK